MSFEYKYLTDVALADVAFEVTADSWPELLTGAALALSSVMVDRESLDSKVKSEITISADSLEELLHDFLSELVYLKDTEGFLVKSIAWSPDQSGSWRASCQLIGEHIDRSKHRLGQDVKAVTYHLFEASDRNGRFYARVVLDI